MDLLGLDQEFNSTANNTTEEVFGRRTVTTLIIYGTMALFWFLYIIFLYKIFRCYIKDKWKKEEAKILEERRKRMAVIRNGNCLAAQEKADESSRKIDGNEIKSVSDETKEKEQKELKVAFNLPEENEEKNKNYNADVPSSKIESQIPKMDFVEYI